MDVLQFLWERRKSLDVIVLGQIIVVLSLDGSKAAIPLVLVTLSIMAEYWMDYDNE